MLGNYAGEESSVFTKEFGSSRKELYLAEEESGRATKEFN